MNVLFYYRISETVNFIKVKQRVKTLRHADLNDKLGDQEKDGRHK